MSAPYLRDVHDRMQIVGPNGPAEAMFIAAGATSIIHQGDKMIGVYVDNETGTAPVGSVQQRAERDAIARKLAWMQHGLVVVGLYPDEPGKQLPGCITALEWYPYHDYSWRALPQHHGGYIVQGNYQPGPRPATPLEVAQLIMLAQSRRPAILWVY